eukprot:jgi/Antlo1/1086/235
MKLSGVFSMLFVLVACAYAGKHYKKQGKHCESSSSSSSEVEVCEPAFAECFKTDRKKHHKKKEVEKCEVYEPEPICEPCEPPRYIQHRKHHHHHKGISRHCRRLLCDIKCLVGESYLYIGQSICHQFSDLSACAKRSMEKSGEKAVEAVIMNMNKLEKDVIEIVKEPLHRAIKKIEGIVVETNRQLERIINEEFERFNERNTNFFNGLLGLADAALLAIVRDTVSGLVPTVQNNTRELQRSVIAAVQRETTDELRRIQEIAGEFMRDVEKEIGKAFQGSEALIRSLLEKIFEKECSHLRCLIEGRERFVESRLRFVVISVEREIEKAISCVASSRERDCGVIRTKLAVFGDLGHGHHGGEACA